MRKFLNVFFVVLIITTILSMTSCASTKKSEAPEDIQTSEKGPATEPVAAKTEEQVKVPVSNSKYSFESNFHGAKIEAELSGENEGDKVIISYDSIYGNPEFDVVRNGVYNDFSYMFSEATVSDITETGVTINFGYTMSKSEFLFRMVQVDASVAKYLEYVSLTSTAPDMDKIPVKIVEKIVEKPVEKIVEKPVEKIVTVSAENPCTAVSLIAFGSQMDNDPLFNNAVLVSFPIKVTADDVQGIIKIAKEFDAKSGNKIREVYVNTEVDEVSSVIVVLSSEMVQADVDYTAQIFTNATQQYVYTVAQQSRQAQLEAADATVKMEKTIEDTDKKIAELEAANEDSINDLTKTHADEIENLMKENESTKKDADQRVADANKRAEEAEENYQFQNKLREIEFDQNKTLADANAKTEVINTKTNFEVDAAMQIADAKVKALDAYEDVAAFKLDMIKKNAELNERAVTAEAKANAAEAMLASQEQVAMEKANSESAQKVIDAKMAAAEESAKLAKEKLDYANEAANSILSIADQASKTTLEAAETLISSASADRKGADSLVPVMELSILLFSVVLLIVGGGFLVVFISKSKSDKSKKDSENK